MEQPHNPSEQEWLNWLEDAISKEHIKYYEYNQFNNVRKFGTGAFSIVYRANWKSGKIFALKALNRENMAFKEIINEINLQRKVDFHENIIRFFGISIREDDSQNKEYVMIIEYADAGSLRNYLKNYFQRLTWNDKYNLAYQLASAVSCLHDEGIIHCDLHSSNVLVNQNTIKIADFGLSKRIEEPPPNESLDIFGVIPYIDPQVFISNNSSSTQKYSLDKKSDVYSFGVLLWEISSNQPPFYGKSYDADLAKEILQGLREASIPDTPADYAKLYKECWDGEPNNRPHISQVVEILKAAKSSADYAKLYQECWDGEPNNSLHISQVVARLKATSSHFTSINVMPKESATSNQDSTYESDDDSNSDNDSRLDKLRLSLIINKSTSEVMRGLVTLFVKIANEGKSRDQRRPILDDYLLSHNLTFEMIYEWLNNNSNMKDLDYIFFMGYLNFSGIGTTLNINKAFDHLKQASLRDHTTAQYYLGICYENGFGTNKDPKAFFCYRQAANNGHAIARYYLGNFYQFGTYVKRDDKKAFDYYNLSAKGEFSFGINILGYCHLNGIGTSVDKKKAFELFLKAAKMNNNVAQYNVAVCFDYGIGITKDFDKAIKWYENSINNGYDRARKRLSELSLLEGEENDIETDQQIVQQWKLNHGLFLDGSCIQPSKQAVLVDDGELNISLYKGKPIVYTEINDHKSTENFLAFNDDKVNFNDSLKQLDLCINFPVAEITYEAELSESFSKFMDDEGKSYDLYGHILAKEFLAGGQLYIKNLNVDITSKEQIDILKFYLLLIYNSAKNNDEIQFSNESFDLLFLPRMETSSGIEIKTPKELANWMNDLYQKNTIEIISYKNLNSIPKLKRISAEEPEKQSEKQPGIANFKDDLSLEKWIGVELYKLISWIKDFHLFQSLVIDKSCKIKNSKKIAINLTGVPKVKDLKGHSYFEIINPTTKLEENLISNNIFSIKNIKPCTFPFIETDDTSYKNNDNIHLVFKYEQYEIQISRDHIKPSEEFNNAIQAALNSTTPFIALQETFNKYGLLFPLRIILGRSLKNITTTDFFDSFENIYLKLPTKSLPLYLNKLNISYLLTQGGDVIEKDNLLNDKGELIEKNDLFKEKDKLEIIELGEIISLYDILELEQRRKIDIILNNNDQDNYKIIMIRIADLKGLDDNDAEHYKQIDVETKLANDNYEVFGSIISKDENNNLKKEEFFVKFDLYDVNGFSVIIKKLEETSIDITKCYVLWMIIGNPIKLSVFSPNNRELQVDCIKRSITLQPDESNYSIETPFPLSQGYTILINATTNYESIKLVEWSYNSISFQITKSAYNDSIDFSESQQTNSIVNLDICILFSEDKNLMIDYKEEKYSLGLFGYILTKENFNENLFSKFSIEPFIDEDILVHSDEPITGKFNRQINVDNPINFSKPFNLSKCLSKLVPSF